MSPRDRVYIFGAHRECLRAARNWLRARIRFSKPLRLCYSGNVVCMHVCTRYRPTHLRVRLQRHIYHEILKRDFAPQPQPELQQSHYVLQLCTIHYYVVLSLSRNFNHSNILSFIFCRFLHHNNILIFSSWLGLCYLQYHPQVGSLLLDWHYL